jgi:hypothetical protein
MKWKGNINYVVCGAVETTDHIFFECHIAKLVWAGPREALGWDNQPRSVQGFLNCWLPLGCKNYSLKLFSCAAVLWSLWTTRNKMAIEEVYINKPADIFYKILANL